jgi:predicted RNase H-like HicB family nuclease
MNQQTYRVEAFWDGDAEVWIAESEEIPGLATEAETIEALSAKLHRMIPELLELNQMISSDRRPAIAFELISHRQELIPGITFNG